MSLLGGLGTEAAGGFAMGGVADESFWAARRDGFRVRTGRGILLAIVVREYIESTVFAGKVDQKKVSIRRAESRSQLLQSICCCLRIFRDIYRGVKEERVKEQNIWGKWELEFRDAFGRDGGVGTSWPAVPSGMWPKLPSPSRRLLHSQPLDRQERTNYVTNRAYTERAS